MLENSLDVVRVFCILLCGPFILVECILSIAYFTSILNDCSEIIQDSFINILVYVIIIMGSVSLVVTALCFYMTFSFGKAIKQAWPDLIHPPADLPNEDALSIASSESNRSSIANRRLNRNAEN